MKNVLVCNDNDLALPIGLCSSFEEVSIKYNISRSAIYKALKHKNYNEHGELKVKGYLLVLVEEEK